MRDDPTAPQSLEEVERHCFALLARGVRDRHSALHIATLASGGRDGFPAARSVVLRAVDATNRMLRFHTDRRSAKYAELEADPRVAILFYDPRARLQFRFQAHATLHRDDEETHAVWAGVAAGSRRIYLGLPPGSPSATPASGLPEELETRLPTPAESAAGILNFAVIQVRLLGLDWLHLAAGGHRRARFAWTPGEPATATWLVP
jgi:pyridoxamine 5'-phosphate oxidase